MNEIMFQCPCGSCIYGKKGEEEGNIGIEGLKLESAENCILVSGNMLACHCLQPQAECMCPLKGCQEVLDNARTKLSFFADNIMW